MFLYIKKRYENFTACMLADLIKRFKNLDISISDLKMFKLKILYTNFVNSKILIYLFRVIIKLIRSVIECNEQVSYDIEKGNRERRNLRVKRSFFRKKTK